MANEGNAKVETAIATLASVQNYRERLNNQVAAVLWAIWAFVLLGIGLATHVQTLASAHSDIGAEWISFAAIVGLTATGAMVTKAVYEVMAIDDRLAAWRPWAYGAGGLALLAGIVSLSNVLAPESSGSSALLLAPVLLAGAVIAAVLTLYMRHTVSMRPGTMASGLLVVAFFNARFADFGGGGAVDVFANLGLVAFIFMTFLVVAYVLFRKG